MRRLGCIGALVFAVAAGAQQAPIQRGVVVQPESVTVGDPFRVVIRVRAPLGAEVEFPAAPDSAEKVEPLDPVVVVKGDDSAAVEQVATYRLAAWDVGRRILRFPDILVRQSSGVRRIEVGRTLSVEVLSVLPEDSTLHVPKPARALFTFGPPWWWWLVLALAAAAVGMLLWWWWRRRHAAEPARRDPYDEAMQEFARIEALGLVGAGEFGQHASLHADVVRTYLARVMPKARTSLTTSELLHALRGEDRVSTARLQRLLHDVDLVKFAGQLIPAARAKEIGTESRALVDAVHGALHPPEQRRAA
jgi:hypothetical protein